MKFLTYGFFHSFNRKILKYLVPMFWRYTVWYNVRLRTLLYSAVPDSAHCYTARCLTPRSISQRVVWFLAVFAGPLGVFRHFFINSMLWKSARSRLARLKNNRRIRKCNTSSRIFLTFVVFFCFTCSFGIWLIIIHVDYFIYTKSYNMSLNLDHFVIISPFRMEVIAVTSSWQPAHIDCSHLVMHS